MISESKLYYFLIKKNKYIKNNNIFLKIREAAAPLVGPCSAIEFNNSDLYKEHETSGHLHFLDSPIVELDHMLQPRVLHATQCHL